jgi:hypothetical protein
VAIARAVVGQRRLLLADEPSGALDSVNAEEVMRPKAAARVFHVNYAPSLTALKPATQPAWYIARGRAAPGQIAVLGSEPGKTDYSPLWRTVIVRWKPGTTPKLLTSDNMILSLAKKGVLAVRTTPMVVNASVLSKA